MVNVVALRQGQFHANLAKHIQALFVSHLEYIQSVLVDGYLASRRPLLADKLALVVVERSYDVPTLLQGP